jgi:precorrin-4/cobalt-precorrin-4 C11-methyltransferase
VHKATWPEEQVVRTTLANLSASCRAAKIATQAMIILSPVLATEGAASLPRSRLYDPKFTHRFRRATPP